MIRPARCRGKCKTLTPHYLCWGGDGVYFTCTKCGEQFKGETDSAPEGTPGEGTGRP